MIGGDKFIFKNKFIMVNKLLMWFDNSVVNCDNIKK